MAETYCCLVLLYRIDTWTVKGDSIRWPEASETWIHNNVCEAEETDNVSSTTSRVEANIICCKLFCNGKSMADVMLDVLDQTRQIYKTPVPWSELQRTVWSPDTARDGEEVTHTHNVQYKLKYVIFSVLLCVCVSVCI